MAKGDVTQSRTTAFERTLPTFAKLFGRTSADEAKRIEKMTRKGITPRLPIVNLLPPRLAVERARRNTKRAFVFAALVVVSMTGFVWVGQAATITLAQQELDSARNEVLSAQAKVTALGDTAVLFAELDQRKALEASLYSGLIDYQKIINELTKSMPAGAELTSLDVTLLSQMTGGTSTDGATPAPMSAAVCGPVTDPFATNAEMPIACVKFSGSVSDGTQLVAIGQILAKSPLLSNVTVSQTGNVSNTGRFGFSATGGIRPTGTFTKSTITEVTQ